VNISYEGIIETLSAQQCFRNEFHVLHVRIVTSLVSLFDTEGMCLGGKVL